MVDTAALSRETLHEWPKAELDCHLDGSLRLGTLLDLAREQNRVDLLPAAEEESLAAELKKSTAQQRWRSTSRGSATLSR